MKTYTINLTEDELNTIINVMVKQSYEISANIIHNIKSQCDAADVSEKDLSTEIMD